MRDPAWLVDLPELQVTGGSSRDSYLQVGQNVCWRSAFKNCEFGPDYIGILRNRETAQYQANHEERYLGCGPRSLRGDSCATREPGRQPMPQSQLRLRSARRRVSARDHRVSLGRSAPADIRVTVSPVGESVQTSSALPCRDSWCSYLHCWKVCRWTSLARSNSWSWRQTD